MLTPEQRIEAYYYAMIEIAEDINFDNYGVCICLDDWSNCQGLDTWSNRRSVFPEFYAHEPRGAGLISWWPDNKQGNLTRLSVLSACIEEVEKQIKSTI